MIGKRFLFLPNGPFSAFFNDFEIFNGPFLNILHRLLWAIFQVNGTMAHGPLPSQSLHFDFFFFSDTLDSHILHYPPPPSPFHIALHSCSLSRIRLYYVMVRTKHFIPFGCSRHSLSSFVLLKLAHCPGMALPDEATCTLPKVLFSV